MLVMSLPPEIATHLNLDGPPVTPRPSATVLVVRGGAPWEVLLMHRPGGADFAPGAYVFPGGSVHDDDRAFTDPIRAAAVRELFEEMGILLVPGARDQDCARLRELLAGGAPFPASLGRAGLRPDFDSLVAFARWITPAQLRRRFDTRFYLARMPEGQSVHPQADEVTDWLWTSPAGALRNPDLTLVYATRAVLESVAGEPDADALFAGARALAEVPVVEPRVVRTEAGWQVVRD
jgi:8-oxo-dGTP pyrophosphatase MutT (NUDIX family)